MSRLRRDLPAAVRAALAEADRLMASDASGNIHSVGWGEKITGGRPTGKFGVVFSVKKKRSSDWIFVPEAPRIPSFIGHGHAITDVIERPLATMELLRPGPRAVFSRATGAHQQCHNTPIPGGVEIQPVGKGWLGTLGCKVVYRDDNGSLRHGAITNWHVATGHVGQQLVQPGGSGAWFAKVSFSPGVSFSRPNRVDLSVLDIERSDGPYAPRTHTVKAEQLTLGAYEQELSSGGLGTGLARDGRTLGRLTNGEIVQIGASVQVGYGQGIALFVDQFIVKCTQGGCDFSAPGDSGSMVFEYPAMKPCGLLFAGGGGSTIVSPAEYILELGRVHCFQ